MYQYTEEQTVSMKKVEATRASRFGADIRRMTAEEKDEVLYAFMKGMPMEEGLSLASLCAACNLSSDDSVSGARSLAQTLALEKQFKRRKL